MLACQALCRGRGHRTKGDCPLCLPFLLQAQPLRPLGPPGFAVRGETASPGKQAPAWGKPCCAGSGVPAGLPDHRGHLFSKEAEPAGASCPGTLQQTTLGKDSSRCPAAMTGGLSSCLCFQLQSSCWVRTTRTSPGAVDTTAVPGGEQQASWLSRDHPHRHVEPRDQVQSYTGTRELVSSSKSQTCPASLPHPG